MNIDGLADAAGMDTWHKDNNPTGQPSTPVLPSMQFVANTTVVAGVAQ